MEKEDSKLIEIERNGKHGFIDKYGKEVVPCIYDSVTIFSDGLCRVSIGHFPVKYGFINEFGEEVIPCNLDYDSVDFFINDCCSVKRFGKYGFIDKSGKEIIPCILDYDEVDYHGFVNGLCKVKKIGKYGFIDKTGKEVIPCDYDDAYHFIDGLIKVKKLGKSGYIDNTSRVIIPCIYDYIDSFHDNICAVKLLDRWGFVSKNFNEGIPCTMEYDNVSFFDAAGLWEVKKSDKRGYIDNTGKEIIPCIYEDFSFNHDMFWALRDGKVGLYSKNGKEIIPCLLECKDNSYCANDYTFYLKQDKWGLKVNKLEITPFKCESPSLLVTSLLGSFASNQETVNELTIFCSNKERMFVVSNDKMVYGKSKDSLFSTINGRCYYLLIKDDSEFKIELILKNYGEQKENVIRNGKLSFKRSDGTALTFDYKGGIVTYLPSLDKWVSTAHITISDALFSNLLQEGASIITQSEETFKVNATYEDYLCLKYLVCPESCSEEQISFLKNLVDIKRNKERKETMEKARLAKEEIIQVESEMFRKEEEKKEETQKQKEKSKQNVERELNKVKEEWESVKSKRTKKNFTIWRILFYAYPIYLICLLSSIIDFDPWGTFIGFYSIYEIGYLIYLIRKRAKENKHKEPWELSDDEIQDKDFEKRIKELEFKLKEM